MPVAARYGAGIPASTVTDGKLAPADHSCPFCASSALSSAFFWASSILSPLLSTCSCCRSEEGAEDGLSAGGAEALDAEAELDAGAELDAEAELDADAELDALGPGSPGPELIPRSTVVPGLTAVPG
jgi:hypothetical protein